MPKVCGLGCGWAPDERGPHSHTATEHQKERRDRHGDRVHAELGGSSRRADDDRRQQAQDLREDPLCRQQGGTGRGAPADVTRAQWWFAMCIRRLCHANSGEGFCKGRYSRARENHVPERVVLTLVTWLEPQRRRLRVGLSAVSATPDVQAHRGSRPTPRGGSCSSRDRERMSVINADARVARSLNSSGFSR